MALKISTAATAKPFTVSDVLKQLRLPSNYTAENDAFAWYIDAATAIAEQKTNLALLPQTWKLTLDKFPYSCMIECSKGPLISITSIKYYNAEGTLQTWDADNYIVDNQRAPWRITPAVNTSWPTIQTGRINAVEITFQAGYATAADIPNTIMQGMRLIIGDLYAHRENIVIGRIVNEIPRNSEILFDLERLDDHHTHNYV